MNSDNLIIMNKSVKFIETNIIYYTYSGEEYDRSNDDLSTLLLKLNARDFGGYFRTELMAIYHELYVYKKNEMVTYNNITV